MTALNLSGLLYKMIKSLDKQYLFGEISIPVTGTVDLRLISYCANKLKSMETLWQAVVDLLDALTAKGSIYNRQGL